MRKTIDNRKIIAYIRNMNTTVRKYKTISICTDDANRITELMDGYAKEKGLRRVSQMDAIGFAIQNEIERFKKNA